MSHWAKPIKISRKTHLAHAVALAEQTPFLDTKPRSMTSGPKSPKLQFDWLDILLGK